LCSFAGELQPSQMFKYFNFCVRRGAMGASEPCQTDDQGARLTRAEAL
jgi:hypothetical protein